MNPLSHFAVLLSVAILISAACIKDSHAASFNCSVKHSVLEILICTDPELSAMDSKEGEAYSQLKSVAPNAEKSSLLMAQRKFLQDRLRVCPIPFKPSLSDDDTKQIITCLKGNYTLRITKLKNELANIQENKSATHQFPVLTGHIVDDAHVISQSTAQSLEHTLADYENDTTNQVVVATIASLGGHTIEDYGYQLGKHWKIGQKGKDNGVLLIVAPNERKVRIEVGNGLQTVLTDTAASKIIQSIILPAFRAKHIEQGIVDGTQAILTILGGNIPQTEQTRVSEGQSMLKNGGDGLPQCDQSVIAKKYYVASCIAHGMEITKQGTGLASAKTKMDDERRQIDCSPDSLDRVHAAANSAAERIVSSGTISSLMEFGDAITLECNKAAAIQGVRDQNPQLIDAASFPKIQTQAEQGDMDAENRLGVMYDQGKGVPEDYGEAVKWYRKSAEQGYAKAKYNLAQMYRQGKGVAQNDVEAVKLYRLAAEQGYAPAQSNLGVMYHEGQGVPQDYFEAVKWLLMAANQGYAEAQNKLGALYYEGAGVPQDYTEAVKWFRKAAYQGNAEAQYCLGSSYYIGQGVTLDKAAAVEWLNKSAEQGNAAAKHTLELIGAQNK